jgi:CelD/BcsL family acetyltransferase involved in cellulose biosynthesis
VSETSVLSSGWHKLSTIEQLQALQKQWLALNQQCGGVLFCSPYWIMHWIEHFWQHSWQLEVWIYMEQGELIALLPCYSQPAINSARRRVLFPLGQGEPESCEVASEFIDLLIAPSWQGPVLQQLANVISKAGYSRICWRAIDCSANIIALSKRLQFSVLRATGIRYQQVKEQAINLSSQLRRKKQKLSQSEVNNQVDIRWLNKQDAVAIWPELKRMHQTRWHKRGQDGAFSCEVFNQFHLRFISAYPDSYHMSILRLKGEIAAIHYYLQSEGQLHFYQAGWSDKYARWSPSAMLHLWSAQHSSSEIYDFMLGGVRSYKQQLSNVQTACYQLDVYANILFYALALIKKYYSNRML